MRNVCFLVGLLLVAAVALPVVAQDSIRFSQPILVDSGSSPQWSPDGSMLAYLSRGGLYVVDTSQFKNPRRVGDAPRGQFQWVGNSGFAWVERPQPKHEDLTWNVANLYYLDLNGNVELVEADSVNYTQRQLPRVGNLLPSFDGTLGYYQVPGKDALQGFPRVIRRVEDSTVTRPTQMQRRFAYLDKPAGYPDPDGDIWMSKPDGSGRRQITHGPNTWMFPVLAQNQLLVAAKNHRGEIVILDSTGAIICNVGQGIRADWSSDSRFLIFNVDEDTGHKVIGSELYLFDLHNHQRRQVTFTPNVIEGRAKWSPSGHYTVYEVEDTGQIFVFRMEVAR